MDGWIEKTKLRLLQKTSLGISKTNTNNMNDQSDSLQEREEDIHRFGLPGSKTLLINV